MSRLGVAPGDNICECLRRNSSKSLETPESSAASFGSKLGTPNSPGEVDHSLSVHSWWSTRLSQLGPKPSWTNRMKSESASKVPQPQKPSHLVIISCIPCSKHASLESLYQELPERKSPKHVEKHRNLERHLHVTCLSKEK